MPIISVRADAPAIFLPATISPKFRVPAKNEIHEFYGLLSNICNFAATNIYTNEKTLSIQKQTN